MNFKPLNDRVLIKPESKKDKIGALFLPEESKTEPTEGIVAALGTGIKLSNGKTLPFNVKVGDKVIFNKFGSMNIEVEGISYKLLSSEDIIAII